MPCCKSSKHCAFGMGGNGCCRLAPAPATPAPIIGQVAPAAMSSPQQRPHPQTIGSVASQAPRLAAPTFVDRLWYPRSRNDSAPLFLRNVSILC